MEQLLHHWLAVWMQFVLDWGYLGIFVMMMFESTALPIPAEVVLPPAAFWAAQGRFNIALIIVAATAGSWVGSALSYYVAWRLGRPLVNRYGKWVLLSPSKVQKADLWFEEYGAGGIFVARLLPGIRHIISIPAGLFRMNFRWFSLMTIIGAGLYNGVLTWFGGKLLGDQPRLMQDPTAMVNVLKSKSSWLIGFGLAVAVLYAIMAWMQKRAQMKRA